ncbi:MAG: glycosyltransferase, partial [Clostridia bacterium]|nr:glycosyltransferase [Clostridia bacterium]
MKIFEINSGNYGSTGNIMLNIAKTAREKGSEVKVAYRKSRSTTDSSDFEEIPVGNSFFGLTHRIFSELSGLEGCFSIIPTLKLVKQIKKFSPDIIHLHILHGWYINLPILFRFLKKINIPVVWTMHDCWAFTGHCPHFQIAECEKWKSGCENCPQYKGYPYSKVDNSKLMYNLKKKYFSSLENLTIVTPSQWLKDLIKQSFLNRYDVKVINNGINLSVFKPVNSDFRTKNNIRDDEFLILGVAYDWDEKKGVDIFERLSKDLPEKYKIVLIGTDEASEKRLPEGIIKIRKTKNQEELVSIYSCADLFVNPTREDTYPTVNM